MTLMPVEAPAEPQHMVALRMATEAKKARSRARASLKAGDMKLAVALAEPTIAKTWVVTVLGWQHKWGTARGGRLLDRLGVEHDIPVGDLTDSQRHVIAGACAVADGTRRHIPVRIPDAPAARQATVRARRMGNTVEIYAATRSGREWASIVVELDAALSLADDITVAVESAL